MPNPTDQDLAEGANKDKRDLSGIISLAGLALMVLIPATLFFVVVNHKEDAENKRGYESSKAHHAAYIQLTKICNSSELPQKIRDYECERHHKQVEALASFQGLAAQQSMAVFTKGLLFSSWVTVVVALFTTALLLVTFSATRKMLHQAHLTTGLAQTTLKQAAESAKAASDAVIAANRTAVAAENAERAYVFPQNISLVLDGGVLCWSFHWINYGNTPVIEFSRNIGWQFYADTEKMEPFKQAQFDDAPSTIGPKQNFQSILTIEGERKQELSDRLTANGDVYVWGSAIYKDIFGETNTSRVCFNLIPEDGDIAIELEDIRFSIRIVDAEWY